MNLEKILNERLRGSLAEEFKVPQDQLTPELAVGNDERPLDSFSLISIATAIDDAHGVYVSGQKIADCRTLGEILALVEAALGGSS